MISLTTACTGYRLLFYEKNFTVVLFYQLLISILQLHAFLLLLKKVCLETISLNCEIHYLIFIHPFTTEKTAGQAGETAGQR
jgi:hypothetical protein